MAIENLLKLEQDNRLKVKQVSAPAQLPVTRAEAAAHLKLDSEQEQEDGPQLDQFIAAATSWCEKYLNRQLITATYANFFNVFGRRLQIWFPPIQNVQSIQYKNDNGVVESFPSNQFVFDNKVEPGEVTLAADQTWPNSLEDEVNIIEVQAKCGYGDNPEDIPQEIKVAILMKMTQFYEVRSVGIEDKQLTAERLLDPYKVRVF
jgi:phage conserved hypothetical protein, phiE125 gp8 family